MDQLDPSEAWLDLAYMPAGVDTLICDYRTTNKRISAGLAIFGALMCGFGIEATLQSTGKTQDQDPRVFWVFIFVGVGLLALSLYYALGPLGRESITVANKTITWRDRRGKVKAHCNFDEILPGSFQRFTDTLCIQDEKGADREDRERLTNGKNKVQIYVYRVHTTRGMIQWTAGISYCHELNGLMDELSRTNASQPSSAAG